VLFLSQILVNGLLVGGLYACIALGFSLVWGVLNILNVLHGSLIMLGAYATFWLFHLLGLDPLASLPLTVVALFLFGYAVQRGIINQVVRAPMFMTLILTFGLDLIVVNVALYLWTGNIRSVAPPYGTATLSVLGVRVPLIRLAMFVLALLITALLFVFLTRTWSGRAIRAIRMDLEAARLMGVPIAHTYALTFGLGAAMAGAGGALMAVGFPFTPSVGSEYLARAFVICVMGGLGNMLGALVGGVMLGLVEQATTIVLGPGYQGFVTFVLLIATLLVRPQGLMGRTGYA
jgi:branched-chain amino acid transport system permease protein